MTRETAYCFAADLGGTKLAAAIADAQGRIVAELTEPTDPRGAAYVAEQIAGCAHKLAKTAGIEITRDARFAAARFRRSVITTVSAFNPRRRISISCSAGHVGPEGVNRNNGKFGRLPKHTEPQSIVNQS